jgi:hypothetical protein
MRDTSSYVDMQTSKIVLLNAFLAPSERAGALLQITFTYDWSRCGLDKDISENLEDIRKSRETNFNFIKYSMHFYSMHFCTSCGPQFRNFLQPFGLTLYNPHRLTLPTGMKDQERWTPSTRFPPTFKCSPKNRIGGKICAWG